MNPSIDSPMPVIYHDVDLCVVGGGMAGVCAALAAARHGARVAIMQDRPVFGGNASSECRMRICGADRHNQIPNMRETGILEELRLENLRRNSSRSFSIWDTILHEKVALHPSITPLLNCSCLSAEMEGARVRSVTGWQLTTGMFHVVRARLFADCSGDAVLAPLTGAEWRMGREARAEYGESIAPEVADERTMGMTCLFQARDMGTPQPFDPPAWAEVFDTCEELPYGRGGHGWWRMGYWWVELGGESHSIYDTEHVRDELLAIVYGVWDHIKNRCPAGGAENWALEWVQFLPGKRESRRYIGDHVLCQGDVEAGGPFPDTVAYGGWSMDDHHPAGFRAVEIGAPATVFHPAPSPYGIPYRSLYSRNIENLMFAGRCASCTHAAMSSTRVMGTASSMGQAIGTAAAMAIERGWVPRQVGEAMGELQQRLLADDAYIPAVQRVLPALTLSATLRASQGDPEPIRDGITRPVGEDSHGWAYGMGDWVEVAFDAPRQIREIQLVLDSDLSANIAMSYHRGDDQLTTPPATLPRSFRIEALQNGVWRTLWSEADNHQRLVRYALDETVEGIRYCIEGFWGTPDESLLYEFALLGNREVLQGSMGGLDTGHEPKRKDAKG
ncbi:MAG: FAD-dependent oxidoreductase [candidate division WS1 bacterium]|nr:FAD-dependent oxidoreductase [candidate division WS1 bacterium]